MTHEFFVGEVGRLITRFGRKNFDDEFINLVWRDSISLSHEQFRKIVDFFIATRLHTKPPLIADFRDARIREEKNAFSREVAGAANAIERPWQSGLKAFLAREYPGCKTLWEAVEVRKLQRQIERANGQDPDGPEAA